MVRLLSLLFAVCLAVSLYAFQSSKSSPVTIASGQISKRLTSNLGSNGTSTFTISAAEGQVLVVNAVGTSPGLAVVATVKAPDGSMDGEKGVPNYAQALTSSGTYQITVSRNLMASTVNQGSFLLEVVLY